MLLDQIKENLLKPSQNSSLCLFGIKQTSFGRRKWQPTPVFLPGESTEEAGWAAVYGVAQSWTRLEKLSSGSRHHLEYENTEQ